MQADRILPQDQIAINFAGESEGKIMNRAFQFTGDGQQIDKNGKPNGGRRLNIKVANAAGDAGPLPEFPTMQYTQLLMDGKDDEAQELTDEYQERLHAYRAEGGADTPTALIKATMQFLADELGVNQNGPDGWAAQENEVVVNVPNRRDADTPGVWVVQPAPVWGSR